MDSVYPAAAGPLLVSQTTEGFSSVAVAHYAAFSAAVSAAFSAAVSAPVSAAVFSFAAHAARPPVGLGILDLPVVEVVHTAEVALPHAVVLVASAAVLDAVMVGGLRHIGIRINTWTWSFSSSAAGNLQAIRWV